MMHSEQGMKNFWKEFVTNHDIDEQSVRPDILDSWKRCLGRVDPFQKMNRKVSTEKEFGDLLKRSRELLEIAGPVRQHSKRDVAFDHIDLLSGTALLDLQPEGARTLGDLRKVGRVQQLLANQLSADTEKIRARSHEVGSVLNGHTSHGAE